MDLSDQKSVKIRIVILRDRDGLIQCVIEDEKELQKLVGIFEESIVQVVGTVKEEKRSKYGVEIINCTVEVLSPVKEKLPIEINKPEIKAGQILIMIIGISAA